MTRHFLQGEAQPRFSPRGGRSRRAGNRRGGSGARVRRGRRRRVRGQPARPARRQPVVGSHARHRRSVYLLPGSHDPLDAASVYRALFAPECPPNVTVLDPPACTEVRPGCRSSPRRGSQSNPPPIWPPGAGRSARRRHHPGAGRPRRRRHPSTPRRPSTVRLAALRDLRWIVAPCTMWRWGDRQTPDPDSATAARIGTQVCRRSPTTTASVSHVLLVDIGADGQAAVDNRRIGRWRFTAALAARQRPRRRHLDMNLDLIPDNRTAPSLRSS